jgi:hypothetical protein
MSSSVDPCTLFVAAGRVQEPGLPSLCPVPWPRLQLMPRTCVSGNKLIMIHIPRSFVYTKILKNTLYSTVYNFFIEVKGTLARDFQHSFFSSKASSWSPDSYLRLFSNIDSNSPRHSNSKVILHIIRINRNKFFAQAGAK